MRGSGKAEPEHERAFPRPPTTSCPPPLPRASGPPCLWKPPDLCFLFVLVIRPPLSSHAPGPSLTSPDGRKDILASLFSLHGFGWICLQASAESVADGTVSLWAASPGVFPGVCVEVGQTRTPTGGLALCSRTPQSPIRHLQPFKPTGEFVSRKASLSAELKTEFDVSEHH